MTTTDARRFELKPIGIIHSPHRRASGTPIQPRMAAGVEGTAGVFAIKPYVPEFDAFEVSRVGWLAKAGQPVTADDRFERAASPEVNP